MKYKCNDCDAVFEGSSYTTECSSCESTNFEPVENVGIIEKIKKWIKENKLVAIASSIFLLLMMCGGPDSTEETYLEDVIYDLEFDITQSPNYCYVYLVNSDDKRVPYSNNVYDFLELTVKIEDLNENSFRVLPNKNKIEYCSAGDVTIYYKTNNGSNVSLVGLRKGVKVIEDVKPNNPNASKCIPNIILGNPKYNSNRCKIIVPVLEGRRHAFISINGKNGSYQSSNEFNSDNVDASNFDIWYYSRGFENTKKKFKYSQEEKNKLLNSLENNNIQATLPISEVDLKNKIIKVINLVRQNRDTDNIWFPLFEYFEEDNPKIKIGNSSCTIFELISTVERHIGDGVTLKDLETNINVKGNISSCGHSYIIKISI